MSEPELKEKGVEAASEQLIKEPDFTLSHLPDALVGTLGITPQMKARFHPLGLSMYGADATAVHHQYFFQDGPQCEEGKDFEKQVWGDIIAFGHPASAAPPQETKLNYMIQACSWPQSHLAPDLQHTEIDKSFYAPYASGPYTAYLLDPPAPAYDQRRLVPVDAYAQFFREDWWQDVFRKFGHQTLKLQPTANSLFVLHTREQRIVSSEVQRDLGMESVRWICDEAFPLLYDANEDSLARWLWLETEDLVLYMATYHRLKYEARTWPRTNAELISRADKSVSDIDELGAAIVHWLAESTAGNLQTAASQQTTVTAFNQAAATIMGEDLLAFDRSLIYAIQYAQALIAMYSLLPEEFQRRIVHETYIRPLRDHLNVVHTKLVALLQKIQTFVTYISSLDGQFFLAQHLQAFINPYISSFQQNANTNGANLEHTIGLMADEHIAPGFDYSRHPRTLPYIPDARKRISMKVIHQKAATRALTHLTASGRSRVLDVVQKWSGILLQRHEAQRRFELSLRDDKLFQGLYDRLRGPARASGGVANAAQVSAGAGNAAQVSGGAGDTPQASGGAGDAPQVSGDAGDAPQVSGDAGDAPQVVQDDVGNAAKVFAITWGRIQG